MGKLHSVLVEHGRQTALQFDFDRRVVDAAAGYLGAEETETAFLFSGWAYTALPHKRLQNDASWTVRTDQASIVVQPGLYVPDVGEAVPVGVPFGSRARLILLYLQSEAIKTNSREIELGRSMNDWLKRMSIAPGGKTIAEVRDQANRIARCRLTFQFRKGDVSALANSHILDQALFVDDNHSGSPLVETARISETYFAELKKHPFPVEEAAIRQIANNSMAIDVYTWLAYRMHALKAPTDITWKALFQQFGHGFGRLDNFRLKFKQSLNLALAVYPAAEVDVASGGLRLHPSKAPVAKKAVKSLVA